MAKKIFKYRLETIGVQRIEMPQGAEILCIQTQNEIPCIQNQNEAPFIWALVEPSATATKRTFEIFGTGHIVPDNVNRKYIGTYQLRNRGLVFHCFEFINLLA